MGILWLPREVPAILLTKPCCHLLITSLNCRHNVPGTLLISGCPKNGISKGNKSSHPPKFTMKSPNNFGPHGHQENHQLIQRRFSFSNRELAIWRPVSLTYLYKYLSQSPVQGQLILPRTT